MRFRQRFIAAFTAVVTASSIIASPLTVMAEEEIGASPIVVEEDAELPYGLAGMPDGFMVSDEEIIDKEEAAKAGMLTDLEKMIPGTDYIDKQIVFTAYDSEYADQVAKAYNAELISCSYGVAVARITDENVSVADAVAAGLDPTLNLPIVSPNHLTPVEEPVISDTSADTDLAVAEEDTIDQSAGWTDALGMLDNPDPFLKPGTTFYKKVAWKPEEQGTSTRAYQWMHDMVGTYEAWWTTTGSKDITVAVIDTGVDADHEDLTSFTDGRSVTNITDVYETPATDPYRPSQRLDISGHGTHVAGIVGATAGNGIGGAGIAPNVNIMGIAIYTYFEPTKDQTTAEGYFDDANIARAINYVAGYSSDGKTKQLDEPRAQIINMSLGGAGYNVAVKQSIDKAYAQKVTVLAAMGNPDTNTVYYPAAYEHVIAVAAVDQAGNKTFFSSYGDWADIAAPGIDIVSTWNGHNSDYEHSCGTQDYYVDDHNDWYASWEGTSMATPVVAGACALYMSWKGNVGPDEMERVLKASATKVSDKSLGAGIVNVAAMLPDSSKDAKLSTTEFKKSATKDGEYTRVKDGDTLEATDFILFDVPEGAASPYFFSYTVNGKNPAFKDEVVAPGCYFADFGKPIPVSDLVKYGAPEGKAFTLKAVYMTPQGTVGKVTPLSITISKDPTAPTLKVYGADFAALGKSVTYSASTEPAGSIAQGVKWTLGEGTASGISINAKTGKVTIKKTVPVNTKFSVVATLNGDTVVTGSKEVTVKEPITAVTIDPDGGTPKTYDPVYKKGSLSSVRLFNVNTPDNPDTTNDESRLDLVVGLTRTDYKDGKISDLTTVSSRPGVAYADWDEKNETWYIKAGRATGTAKITWTAVDGSGKKASVTVKNIVPVSSVTVITKNYQELVGYGNSVQFVGVPGSTYGKPTISKLNWKYEVMLTCTNPDDSTDIKEFDVTQDWKDKGLAKITQNGKLTVNKKAADYQAPDAKYEKWYKDIDIKATATATDGTKQEDYFTVKAASPIKNVRWRIIQKDGDGNIKDDSKWVSKSGTYDMDFYLTDADSDKNYSKYIYIETEGCDWTKSEMVIASSSKPKVVSLDQNDFKQLNDDGEEVEKGGTYCLRYPLYTGLPGEFKAGRTETVKLTFAANDGSGKKSTVTLKIHGK